MRNPIPGKKFGTIIALATFFSGIAFRWLINYPRCAMIVKALPILPFVILISATNGLSEEVMFRSALLAPLQMGIHPSAALPSRLSPYACTLTTGLATAARPSASRTNSWPNSRTQISSGAWPKEKKKTIVFFSCPALRPGQGARLVFSGPTGGRPPPGSRFPFPSRSPG